MAMKTIKVADATNTQLDWLVATCEDVAFTLDASLSYYPVLVIKGEEHLVDDFYSGYSPTTRPEQMWPIIEGEGIDVCLDRDRVFDPGEKVERWFAWMPSDTPDAEWVEYGPTSLIAAARCYCCAKLGDVVEIPEELCQQQSS